VRSRNFLEVWRFSPLYLMRCIWRKRNARSKDREISVVELKNIMFKSLYTWIVVYNSLPFSSFSDFFGLSFFLSLIGSFSCILPVY
jgi:hypothetical protein